MSRRRLLLLSAGAVALDSMPVTVLGQPSPPLDPVRIVTGQRSAIEILGWIATATGIFDRLGIEARVKLDIGESEAVAGLVRGDWDFVEAGSASFVQAMLDGRDPVILLAAMEPVPGLPVLVRPSVPGHVPGFLPAVLGCTRRMAETQRDVVSRVVRGYVEAIHFFKTRPAEAIALLQRFLGSRSRAAVEDIYQFCAPRFQPLPRPSPAGIEALLKELARRNPAAASLAPATVSDPSFLDELERSGHVRTLYAG